MDTAIELTLMSRTDFLVQHRYPLTLSFTKREELVINAGRWHKPERVNGSNL